MFTLILFALFAHTGLGWADEGWITTYSYATGSDCSGEVIAIRSAIRNWKNECSHVSKLFSAYEDMEHVAVKFQCTGSNDMAVTNHAGDTCSHGVDFFRTIRSGECNVDNEGKAFKLFFNCWTGSKHDYDSDEPSNKVQLTGKWHDESTCSGSVEYEAFSTDVVLKQDHCYKAGDDENTWQNSFKLTCDGDVATQHMYHTSDCSDEPRMVDTVEDSCLEFGEGNAFFEADVTCGEQSMFDQALSWFKQQAEDLGISEKMLVGLVAGGGSMGGLTIVLLVYRCCCTGSRKRSTALPRLRDLV